MTNNETTLIVLRGPSGSGKSSAAKMLRASQEGRIALIEQDYLRRTLLREKDIAGGLNIELIKTTVLLALQNSYHVILEGIFDASRYEQMFEEILRNHPKNNHFFYFDISFEETLRRHEYRPDKQDFGETKMRRWYKEKDFLACVQETIIPEIYSLDQTVDNIISRCHLLDRSSPHKTNTLP